MSLGDLCPSLVPFFTYQSQIPGGSHRHKPKPGVLHGPPRDPGPPAWGEGHHACSERAGGAGRCPRQGGFLHPQLSSPSLPL